MGWRQEGQRSRRQPGRTQLVSHPLCLHTVVADPNVSTPFIFVVAMSHWEHKLCRGIFEESISSEHLLLCVCESASWRGVYHHKCEKLWGGRIITHNFDIVGGFYWKLLKIKQLHCRSNRALRPTGSQQSHVLALFAFLYGHTLLCLRINYDTPVLPHTRDNCVPGTCQKYFLNYNLRKEIRSQCGQGLVLWRCFAATSRPCIVIVVYTLLRFNSNFLMIMLTGMLSWKRKLCRGFSLNVALCHLAQLPNY